MSELVEARRLWQSLRVNERAARRALDHLIEDLPFWEKIGERVKDFQFHQS